MIHLDIDYMRGYRVFTWNPAALSRPGELVGELAEAGFKMVTIIDPGVKYDPDAGYAVFDEGLASRLLRPRRRRASLFHGYVWPDKAVFPDFLRPDVRAWWGDWQRALTEAGVAGIWNDMNEPALDDRPFGDRRHEDPLPPRLARRGRRARAARTPRRTTCTGRTWRGPAGRDWIACAPISAPSC